jgi:lipopolysaccharide biosynthesis glycosyltransferase
MASMLYNTRNPVHFHVIESRLSEQSKKNIVSLEERFPNGCWTFYGVESLELDRFAVTGHFSVETYYRLFLPELIPNLKKIIYIDGDTVIDGDIVKLWQIELGKHLAGAVPELYQPNFQSRKRHLGMNESDIYFNAGVLVLNLAALREFSLLRRASEVVKYLYNSIIENNLYWFVDQDILNHLFYRRCLFLPPKFNFSFQLIYTFECEGISLEEWQEAIINPVIVHYTSPNKPSTISKKAMHSPFWEMYYKYKIMTPFSDVVNDNKRIEKYRLIESEIGKSLILPYTTDAFFQYNVHFTFVKLAKKLHEMLQNRKLALWGTGKYIKHLLVVLSANKIYTDVIVDGLDENQNKRIFDYIVQEPTILQGRSDKYFVLLCMPKEKIAAKVGEELIMYGFKENEYMHVFSPIWVIINERL